jgi:pilus assembly protein CpaC
MYASPHTRFILTALLVVALTLPATALAQGDKPTPTEENEIELVVGAQRVLSAEGVAKYSEGTPGIVDVRLPKDASQFVIVALSPGTTTLLLLMKDGREVRYTITVRSEEVKRRANIRLDFYFVQLTSRSGYRVGVGWPGTIGGSASASTIIDLKAAEITSATASVAAQVLPRIDFAQSSGWAKLLREATLVVANGEPGRFASGGEVNFRVESATSAGTLQSISFGSKIEVQPRYDRKSGRIDLRISAEVSELTEPSPDGLPGRTVANLETSVNLELGQSIVLAGLVADSQGMTSDGLPGLSQIPVLGYLFGTKTTRREQSENLIFIVPTVVDAIPVDARDRVRDAFETYRRFDGQLARDFEDRELRNDVDRAPARKK